MIKKKKNLVALVSGSGSNMAAILDAIDQGKINGQIVAVISSNDTAYALTRAFERGIPTHVCSLATFGSPDARDREVLKLLDGYEADYVLLAGYLGIISPFLVDAYPNKIVNIHPALLPKFGGKGFHGLHVHEAVIAAKEKESGATVHFVDGGTDTGPIILQRALQVLPSDTPEVLQARILEQIEHKIFPEAVAKLCNDEITVVDGKVVFTR